MTGPVIITGGSGLLALNWAAVMRNRYRIVLGLHERQISLSGVQAMRIPLDSVRDLAKMLVHVRPRVVIHTAGLTDVAECERRPELAHHVNVVLSENVARACAEARAPLVHISTDHLFSGDSSLVSENEPVFPLNVYARTKAEAERVVLNEYPEALVARTNFYGWGTSYRNSFSDFIIDSLRQKHEMKLFRDVFYTPILIEALVVAVHELVDRHAQGIFHLVGDDRISKYEFGLMLADEFDLDAKGISEGYLAQTSPNVKRPLDMSLSNKKASTLLGRKLGGVEAHIAALHQQERNGLSKEMKKL